MDIEQKRRRIATGMKWGIGLVAAAVVAPVMFLAIQGLVGLIIAGLLGLAIINFAPMAGMKFANWKLKGMKAEARANPIETMQNQLIEARRRIAEQWDNLKNFMAGVNTFKENLKSMPPEEAAEFQAELARYEKMVEFRKAKQEQAHEQAKLFERKIESARRRWNMAQQLQALNKASGSEADLQLETILREEATDAVAQSLGRAMAEMDVAFAQEVPAITNNPAPSLMVDVSPVAVQEKVRP